MTRLETSCPGLKIVLVLVTLMLMASTAAASQPGTWAAKADLPAERLLTATAEVNGVIYTIGGWADSQVFDTVFVFDPGNSMWNHWGGSPMPTARGQAAAAVVDGKIYVIGGAIDSSFTATTAVEVYDPATNSWEVATDLPGALWSPAAATVDGKIYVIGGGTGDLTEDWDVFSSVHVYDPASDNWDTATDMPTARSGLGVSVVDGLIYAVGGALEDEISSALEIYDPATDTWTVGADLTTPREWLTTAAIDGKVYAFGGLISGDRVVHEVEVFDPSTGNWRYATRMPDQRFGQGTAVVDGTVYLIGGGPTVITLQSNHVDTYDPDLYTSWTEVAAHLPGNAGSLWRTDVCSANLNDESANVEFVLHTDENEYREAKQIGPRQQIALNDVVGEMGVEGKGMLAIQSDQPLKASGRTFSEEDNGTFGQFCEFRSMDDGFVGGDHEVYLVGLRQDDTFRTNLVFANSGIRTATLFVTLFRCSGEALTTFVVELDPGKFEQRIETFAVEGGQPNLGMGYAKVMVINGAGILISASVIDSRTNDATTIRAER